MVFHDFHFVMFMFSFFILRLIAMSFVFVSSRFVLPIPEVPVCRGFVQFH